MAQNDLESDPDYIDYVISADDLDRARALLSNGWPVNGPNQFGEPPLWQAAMNGFTGMVRLLLEFGADVRLPNSKGETPVEAAFEQFHGDVVQSLIEAGSDTSVLGAPGCVELAISAMRGDVASMTALLAHGIDVNCTLASGRTPLICAVGADQPEGVKLMLRHGADCNKSEIADPPSDGGRSGFAPIHHAAYSARPEILEILLDAGADPNRPYGEGRTALTDAAFVGDPRKIKLLLDFGADVRGAMYDGLYLESPLAEAAWQGREECVRILLANGAGKDRFSLQQAFRSAYVDNGRNTVPLLIEAGAEIGLFEAVGTRDADRVLALIAEGADVNERDYLGRTPLIYSLDCMHMWGDEIESSLLEAGTDANASTYTGRTALSCIDEESEPRMAALLRRYGATH